ncbi:alpha/beta hydrolase [Algibacter sp.]|uniref:alpha/beta hydrolase n=1 Tax=Algibacter sp. TaxID=1872428 RepID=UPI003C779E36
MNTYLLIHGAWHGAWCWDKVIPILEKQGHKVIAPDLPGHGKDKIPVKEVSLKAYTDYICEIIDSLEEQVILVGHSMGGLIMSQVAEYRSNKIEKLVYIAAFVLKNEESILPFIRKDAESLLIHNIEFSKDMSSIRLNENEIKNVFYGDCSDEDISRAKSLVSPQSFAPIKARLNITNEKFERVPKIYIECLRDKAISITMQRKMYAEFSWQKVLSMDSSHSPFFSSPKALVSKITMVF